MQTSTRSRSEQMAEELMAQEERAVAKYGHHKKADESWPPEFHSKMARWQAELRAYEIAEVAEMSSRD